MTLDERKQKATLDFRLFGVEHFHSVPAKNDSGNSPVNYDGDKSGLTCKMPGNRTTKNLQEHIIISPIGSFDPQLLDQVGREVHRITGYSPLTAALLQDIDFAFESSRDQHYSTPILEKLADLAPPGTVKILAICSVDLFIPILTYVYGEAQLGGKACIISIHRLSEGLGSVPSEIFFQRIVKEAIHELGHTFNLRHCKDHSCCMHYCRTIKDVDRKTHHLCRYCKVLLEDEMKRMSKHVNKKAF